MKRNRKGQFVKGTHWRAPKPYWDKNWLEYQYTTLEKSGKQIADEQGCKQNNIFYFLDKHNIPRRSMEEIRKIKYWGLAGEHNGMHGCCGESNPNWRGGISPERQAFCSSEEWKNVVPIIWERDSATCQRCGCKKEAENSFHIHHIISFEVIELRADERNLILFCKDCHDWVHSKENKNGEFIGALLDAR